MVDTRAEYEELFAIFVPIAVGLFVVISGTIVAYAVRYRRRKRDWIPAHQKHENNLLESAYVAALVAVAAFLVWQTFATESKIDALAKQPGLRVNVTAAQWNWRFTYPRYDITIAAEGRNPKAAGARTADPTLVVPTDTTVRFETVSLDVVHSFWVPARRFKRDVFPGPDRGRFDLMWPKEGLEKGECAEFCGLDHAVMEFSVRALSPERFERWARANRGSALIAR